MKIARIGPLLLLVLACREPTQLRLHVRTNVSCADVRGLVMAVGSTPELAERRIAQRAFAATGEACTEGDLGTLVITPGADTGAIVAVLGLADGAVARDCAPPGYEGCLVQRRRFRFIDHRTLELSVNEPASCRGISCDALTTCRSDICQSSEVDCETGTCEFAHPDLRGADGDATLGDAGPNDGGGTIEGGGTDGGDPSCAGLPGAWPLSGRCRDHTRRSSRNGPSVTPTKQWSADIGVSIRTNAVVGSGGRIFFTNSTLAGIYAFDSTGTKAWDYPDSTMATYAGPALTAAGLYVVSQKQKFEGLGVNGAEFTNTPMSDTWIAGAPAVGYDGTLYIPESGDIEARMPDGSNKWTASLGLMSPVEADLAIDANGTIYAASGDGNLWAVEPKSGTVLWQRPIAAGPGFHLPYGPAVGSDGTIYVPAGDGSVYAFTPNGQQKWKGVCELNVVSPVALAPNDVVICGQNSVVALSPTNGTQLWSVSLTSPIASHVAIGANADIYVATSDTLYDVGQSAIVWSIPAQAGIGAISIGEQGELILAASDRLLVFK
jgi:outer membrane protein assembly factor BamB